MEEFSHTHDYTVRTDLLIFTRLEELPEYSIGFGSQDITIPLALLVSFSRRVKESDAYIKYSTGPYACFGDEHKESLINWRDYLESLWGRNARGEALRGMGTDEQSWKATRILSHVTSRNKRVYLA